MLSPRIDHLSRRELLKGLVGTTAGGVLLNWGNLTNTQALADDAKREHKSCILIWLNGGASQFETFDPKPDRPTGGPFRPIDTNVPGAHICELMPKMAQQMDKIAVIRSMRTSEIDHPGGIHLMHTGYKPLPAVRYPEVGAIVAKYQGREVADLPNFIKIFPHGNTGAGYLGPKYQPFGIGPEGGMPPFLTSSMDAERERQRHELRSFVENNFATETKAEVANMHREAYEASRRLQKGLGVFKIESEWDKLRDLYGDSAMGRRLLMARRLVEAGVAFVEVGQSGYDTHSDNFEGHRGLVPSMEHAWAGLLVDLKQRGLLDKTLIVWVGEIGRTPYINNRAGRDHYVRSWSTALAGCGVKGGLVYGASDENGADVKDNPVSEGDFFATIYTALGIDPKTDNYAGLRPIPLAPAGSKVVKDLLA